MWQIVEERSYRHRRRSALLAGFFVGAALGAWPTGQASNASTLIQGQQQLVPAPLSYRQTGCADEHRPGLRLSCRLAQLPDQRRL